MRALRLVALPRQREAEHAPLPDLARDPHVAPVALHELLHDHQPQAGAGDRVIGVERARVLGEQLGQRFGSIPGPGVLHLDLDVLRAARRIERAPSPPAGENLIAFESRFEKTCVSRGVVRRHDERRLRAARSRA